MQAETYDGMSYEDWESCYGATPYAEWCEHYGYDAASEQARIEYGYYLDGVALMVESFAKEEPAPAVRPD